MNTLKSQLSQAMILTGTDDVKSVSNKIITK